MFGQHGHKLGSDVTDLKAKQYSLEVRLDEMRTEVARLTLLTRALADACVESGAFTKATLKRHFERLDADTSLPRRGMDVSKALDGLLSDG